MSKELVIAIIVGALLGAGLTFGLNQYRSTPTQITNPPTPIIAKDTTPAISKDIDNHIEHQLTITSPDNETVVNTDTITIRGTTSPLSHLVIDLSTDTFYIDADQDGNFSQEVELEGGSNIIQIISFSPLEESVSTDLLITYSTSDF